MSDVLKLTISDQCRERGNDVVRDEVVGAVSSQLDALLRGWHGKKGASIIVRIELERLPKGLTDE